MARKPTETAMDTPEDTPGAADRYRAPALDKGLDILEVLAGFAAAHPDLPLVIDHAAKPRPGGQANWMAGMRALAAIPHVHCKLSGLLTELAPENLRDPLPVLQDITGQLLDWFGADRLIWGSDWPVLTETLLEGLSASERAAIMGGNATKFYGVTP